MSGSFLKSLDFNKALLYFGTSICVGGWAMQRLCYVTMSEYTPKSTYSSQWQAATKKYLKFQNMNPIGLTEKAYDPAYVLPKKNVH